MFWILRRTQLASAANFFNSINNNGGSNNNSNNTNDRKGYNKLSGSDEPDVTYCTDNGGDGKCCGLAHGDTNSNSNMASSGSMKAGLVASAHDMSDSESNFTDIEVDPLSDDSEYDEALTCNVCDRSFATMRHLGRHQQKKRHFGCSACDSLFPSLMALEHHKEEFEHWSGDESCDDASQSGDDTSQDTVTSEELERLL